MESLLSSWSVMAESKLPVPGGSKIWARVEEFASVILTVAVSILAFTIAPIPFLIGTTGSLACRLIVPLIMRVLKRSSMIVNSSAYSLAGNLLEATFIAGSLVCAHQLTASKVVLMPIIICTLCGYYLPLSAYYEIKGLLLK